MKQQTLDMRFIRYLNLFEKITGVRTKNCFFYNRCLIFAVPSSLISKAIGLGGKNVKKVSYILGKKIKIVSLPASIGEAEKFISDVISPTEFKSLEITEQEMIITASRQNKAALFGRNKVRLEELKKIIEEIFGKKLRIA